MTGPQDRMATFSIENFGCRATAADAAALRSELAACGHLPASGHDSAGVVVLNTCTVTAEADAQAREAVRKIHRANPAARIVVTGCYAQRAPEELAALEGVTWVVGNSHQGEISRLIGALPTAALDSSNAPGNFISLETLAKAKAPVRPPAPILAGDIFSQAAVQIAPAAFMAADRTRPILKIQDGCDHRCSFCVIPQVRGASRSLPPDAVVEGVRRLAESGAREIVLSGINLGGYGRDLASRATLAGVVRRILDETEIERLRLSSIEPQDITEDFVALMAGSPRLAPHFHVPLQSGSDSILRAMRRWYRTEHYAERIHIIRRRLPEAAIGADVIAGFPGETPEDFRATLGLIERLPLTYLHVFSFSPRPGTPATSLGEALPRSTVLSRARALRSLGREKTTAFRTSLVGRVLRALTLRRQGPSWTEALTGNYLRVRIAGLHPANQWREIRLGSGAQSEED